MSEQRQIMTAKDLMKAGVVTIDGMATVREAMRKMRDNNVTCLVVKKRHPNDAWGLIAVLDLAKGVIATNRNPDQTHVYEVMAKPIITVRPELDIRYVAGLFSNHRLRRAPVEDGNGDLIGMISLSDLVFKGADIL
ncbi:MAG: CBS domain-containing protein [Magnetococcales bacterium]|nr:CBS domain-containing protein [Magnetococcales bacterium]